MPLSLKQLALLPLITTLVGLCLLVGLGTWQVIRLSQKEALLSQLENYTELRPVFLDRTTPDDPTITVYNRADITGELDYEHEIHLYTGPKQFRGVPGYHILTPLRTKDGTTWLINRGWTPKENKQLETRRAQLVPGVHMVTGILVPFEKARWFMPENDIKDNVWIWLDKNGIEAQIGQPVAPYIVLAFSSQPEFKDVIANQTNIPIRNDHLYYAITWYLLAAALLAVYIAYIRKQAHSA